MTNTERFLIGLAAAGSTFGFACAQTQPTRPSVYATAPTLPSAFATAPLSPCYGRRGSDERYSSSFNPTSPCYSGTAYPSYSALEPFQSPKTNLPALSGANTLDQNQAKLRLEAKGYSQVSGLQKDSHGIWRGNAILKDGRSVVVILDLEGNIYSELSPRITIRPLDRDSR
jgi:hypothetical protein